MISFAIGFTLGAAIITIAALWLHYQHYVLPHSQDK